jgi:hypothetical protein
MKIVVDTGMTYETGGYEVKEGDTVVCPPTPWMTEPFEAKVVNTESSYDGPCKLILSIRTQETNP